MAKTAKPTKGSTAPGLTGFRILPGSDEEVPLDPPANGKSYGLKECQALVGGYIEMVNAGNIYGANLTVLADEEGLLKGLPYNEAASTLCGIKLCGPVVFIPSKQFK